MAFTSKRDFLWNKLNSEGEKPVPGLLAIISFVLTTCPFFKFLFDTKLLLRAFAVINSSFVGLLFGLPIIFLTSPNDWLNFLTP